MRRTIVLPDELYQRTARSHEGSNFSGFVCEAIQRYLQTLEGEKLARKMAEGYVAEANDTSLPAKWSCADLDGWR